MATAVLPTNKQIYLGEIDHKPIIQDLFIYTSLVCNKSCHHCFVSSTPTNKTLDEMSIADLDPVWDELKSIKTGNIYFTGGEPFLNKEIMPMLQSALKIAPVTIYTNAARPLEKKLAELETLSQEHQDIHGKPILLRVSLDHTNADIHDVYYGRDDGAWVEAVRLAVEAARLGLDISITTQSDIHNQAPDSWVEKSFVKFFQEKGVELRDVKVLPDIPTGKHASDANSVNFQKMPMSEAEYTMAGTPETGLMCHTGRTLIKLSGKLQVFPCTLIIPDQAEAISVLEEYSMGTTLQESLAKGQVLDHPACRAYCVVGKQSCAN